MKTVEEIVEVWEQENIDLQIKQKLDRILARLDKMDKDLEALCNELANKEKI